MRTIFVGFLFLLTACVSYQGTPVSEKMTDGAFLAGFFQSSCGFSIDEKGTISDDRRKACARKWASEFLTRLHQTYPKADLIQVRNRCDASPQGCVPGNLERWTQDSQDSEVEQQSRSANRHMASDQNEINRLSTPCD
jgi:hypothetical protein